MSREPDVQPGTERTRAEHLDWCKARALEYLDRGDVNEAVASMLSDLRKHPGTIIAAELTGGFGLLVAASGDAAEARRFIEGFA